MSIFILLFSVFLSSASQIVLKQSAKQEHENFIQEYLNVRVILAYTFFFFSTFISMFAYRDVPLSVGVVLEATGYFWIALFGLICLKEPISRRKWAGLGIILCGILIFNI